MQVFKNMIMIFQCRNKRNIKMQWVTCILVNRRITRLCGKKWCNWNGKENIGKHNLWHKEWLTMDPTWFQHLEKKTNRKIRQAISNSKFWGRHAMFAIFVGVCFGAQIGFATACLLFVILKFQREQRLEEQVGNLVKIIFSLFQSTYLIKNIMNLSIILSGHEQWISRKFLISMIIITIVFGPLIKMTVCIVNKGIYSLLKLRDPCSNYGNVCFPLNVAIFIIWNLVIWNQGKH